MASVRRIRLAYNNVYLFEREGTRVLIDTGPDYAGAWDALRDAIDGAEPELVVATHGHNDHASLGAAWQDRGVPVAMGAADAVMAREPGMPDAEADALAGWVRASGAPAEVVAEALAGVERRRAAREQALAGYPSPGSQSHWPTGLRFRPFAPNLAIDSDTHLPGSLRALRSPGHTPGNLVVVDGENGWLFSGDQLLPDLTPTPAIQFDPSTGQRFHSLPPFRASLARLGELRFERCYPGHGEPFDDVARHIRLNLNAIDARTGKADAALREYGPATLYGLTERLYPRAVRRRFWQFVPTVQGHLDLLEAAGRALGQEGVYSAR
jgi:glyoxylase-like metal-dependent hydrolase (beta-lactamase superfamily II)